MRNQTYHSWGRYPRLQPERVVPLYWQNEVPALDDFEQPVLPYGLGRSYGDSCLNDAGVLLDITGMNRFIAFDRQAGLLRCEAGISLAEILDLIVPQGWFLPVTPGTKFVTIGGAIASDVHGKNHHCEGTFGRYVERFELLLSDGGRLICSEKENADLYRATIGGLGLTGLILWADIRLKPVQSPFIDLESIRFRDPGEFFRLSEESNEHFNYTVSWIDSTSGGSRLGRGIFMRGNHASADGLTITKTPKQRQIAFPIEAPSFLLNYWSIRLFNQLYYARQIKQTQRSVVYYDPFFYPLDAILHWNRMYGKRGFFQYQFVLPFNDSHAAITEILERITRSKMASFLAVLKTFGDLPSPGLLSFPRPGVTLALDFPNYGERLLQLFTELDRIVASAGGAIYPAKDARMSPEMFAASFPQWREFSKYIDPQFSSSFWRRVTAS